jgi:hypothetical protein
MGENWLMTSCSFLSSTENKVECFNDCVFYNWEENGGVCPFRNLTGNKYKKLKGVFPYDMFGEDNIGVKEIEQYYLEKDYI